MADGYLNFDTKINEKGFNDGINKLCGLAGKGVGSIAGIASKANGIFAALSSSVAGVIIKQSLGVVANMEQRFWKRYGRNVGEWSRRKDYRCYC